MKTSYALLSIFLDGVPIPENAPPKLSLTETVNIWDIKEEPNLFDYPSCRRKVSSNDLLSLSSADELKALLNMLDDCKQIIVTMDYKSRSTAARRLYAKRVLQAITLLSENNPNTVFLLADDESTLQKTSNR